MSVHDDLVILGSGSTAFAAALKAAELGKTAVMTEERTLGGTCVNRGCLPSKNLIEAARLYHDAHAPRYPGLEPRGMGLDFAQLIAQKGEVIAHYRDRKYASLVGADTSIRVVRGHATFTDPHTVRVSGGDDGEVELHGERFLIASGSRPVIPPIPGLDQVDYLTSDLLTVNEGLELTELPPSLVVIGGGYIALELGQLFHRFGAEVTILARSARILRGYEPVVAARLQTILRDEGVHLLTSASVRQVQPDGDGVVLTVAQAGQERELRAAQLLVAAGRRPNTDQLGLDQVGVETDDQGWVVVDDELRTTAPRIYAAGDVIGRHTGSQMATPVGAHDGALVARNALAEAHQKVDHRVVPRVIFTDPPLAVVGLTEDEAETQGIDCRCDWVDMDLVPRAGAIRDTRGVIKLTAERGTNRLLGVHMLGPSAGEVIHAAVMALRFGATLDDLIEQVYVYPTMAEALKIAAIAFFKDPSKLSCCAE